MSMAVSNLRRIFSLVILTAVGALLSFHGLSKVNLKSDDSSENSIGTAFGNGGYVHLRNASEDRQTITTNLNRNKKPTLIIHTGPPKTGTSTIQTNFHRMSHVLEADNYEYRGRLSPGKRMGPTLHNLVNPKICYESLKQAIREHGRFSASPCWNSAIKEIKQWRRSNRSIFFSDETISFAHPKRTDDMYSLTISALKEALSDDWNVFVLLGYRRYAEWLISSVKQIHSRKCTSERVGWEDGFCAAPWDFIEKWINRRKPAAANFHFLSTELLRWNESFPVKILNTHASGDLIQRVSCEVLPDAPRTCEYTRKTTGRQNFNVRSPAISGYSSIALAAYKQGLVPNNTSRVEVIEEMEAYLHGELGLSYRHLPLKDCPSQKELEQLLNISLRLEREWMPLWYESPEGEAEHRKSFWRMAHEKKEFCAVDVETVVANRSSWKEVLEALARQDYASAGRVLTNRT